MAKRKHDPFFTHLWDELVGARLLESATVARWIDLPAKLQSQFVDAAQRAMNAALGAPPKPRKPARIAAKKPKAKAKAKARPKAKKKVKKG
ncbi:MAG TPA: hypothetical protein VHE77_12165 [Dongiaceae bacterium]|nr:hypothetical protein [Dongiaceae bacterium]